MFTMALYTYGMYQLSLPQVLATESSALFYAPHQIQG